MAQSTAGCLTVVASNVAEQGKDCFEAFMQWGLPKGVLRNTWNLVAGNLGQLDARQFISCVYLMDMVKKVLVHVLYAMSCSLIRPSPTKTSSVIPGIQIASDFTEHQLSSICFS